MDTDALDAERLQIDHLVSRWIDSVARGEYHDVLSFYSADYLPDMTWWMDWRSIRKDLKQNSDGISLTYDFAGIFSNKDYFVVFVDMKICSDQSCMPIGRKKLFVTKKNTEYRIVGDFFHTSLPEMPEKKYPVIFAAEKLFEKKKNGGYAIRKMLDNWLKAWSSDNMNTYADFYHKNFYSEGMNKKQWVAQENKACLKI